MTGAPSPELKRYFAEARRWDQDRLAEALRSRRLAWIAAGAATALAASATLAVALLTPLKTTEPFVIRVDQATGAVDVVRGLSADGAPARYDEAVSKYFLAQYVRAREGYLDPAAEDAYSLLFQQLVDLNSRVLPGPGDQPALVLLDEFARLGPAPVLAHAFSFVAGYGLRLLPVIQSPSQLRALYGPDVTEEILTNCGVEVVFAPRRRKR